MVATPNLSFFFVRRPVVISVVTVS